MPVKKYHVYFTTSKVSGAHSALGELLEAALKVQGQHLPIIPLEEGEYQIRGLQQVGKVWKGAFARLKHEAPHIVDASGDEHEIVVNDGDRFVEKCHFLYSEKSNTVTWQVGRNIASLDRLARYLSVVGESVVQLPFRLDDVAVQRMLSGDIYEVTFAYARPPDIGRAGVHWSRTMARMMRSTNAAYAKFTLRAPRKEHLLAATKDSLMRLLQKGEVAKMKVRLTDGTDPLDLIGGCILKEYFQVEFQGRYPPPHQVFQGLNDAYEARRGDFA